MVNQLTRSIAEGWILRRPGEEDPVVEEGEEEELKTNRIELIRSVLMTTESKFHFRFHLFQYHILVNFNLLLIYHDVLKQETLQSCDL